MKKLSLLALLAALGCNASYAPPIRSTHYGLPGRLRSGQGELAVAVAIPHTHGGAALSIPVARDLRIEGSYDLSESWHVGSAGLRGTLALSRLWTLDLEGGIGAGVGGERCANNPDVTHSCSAGLADGQGHLDRFAYGGYLGAGIGLRPWHVVGFFVRARSQLSASTNVPLTAWNSAVLGAEFAIGPVRTSLSGGAAVYVNSAETEAGALIELGLSVPFDLSRR